MNWLSVLGRAIVAFVATNIGIYVPLFANSDATALLITLITFGALIAVWCVAGYYLGSHSTVKRIAE
jgi:cadmium resistance protein CadD (predicted permease)